jgi:predicted PurR-regulated permease PerM
MLVAADYPFMNVFWSILIFFAWVCWIMILFRVFADLFRRHDVSGWGKAAWVVLMIVLPFLGVLVYLIAQGRGMADRDVRQAQAAQEQFDEYVKTVATKSGPADQIDRAKQLLDRGAIDQAEFARLKEKALA